MSYNPKHIGCARLWEYKINAYQPLPADFYSTVEGSITQGIKKEINILEI